MTGIRRPRLRVATPSAFICGSLVRTCCSRRNSTLEYSSEDLPISRNATSVCNAASRDSPKVLCRAGDPLVELEHVADRFAEQCTAGEQPGQCEPAGLDLSKVLTACSRASADCLPNPATAAPSP